MFKDFFCNENVPKETIKKDNSLKITLNTPEDILRSNSFKIKLVTKTLFGKQIDFAKKYPDEEIKKVLSDFNFKIKDKSIFIIE